jgi:hypothetical protein
MKVGSGRDEPQKGQAQDPTPVQKDLFRAHMRVIHRHQEQLSVLSKSYHRVRARVDRIDQNPTLTTPRDLVALSDELVELEQDWEDIQRSYNRQSENIEEDFLDRISEMEADIELAPDQQHAIEQEIRLFVGTLEKSDEELRQTARLLDVLRARGKRGLLGTHSGYATLWIASAVAALLVCAGCIYARSENWLSVGQAALVAAPGLAGVALLVVLCRLRKI